MSQRPGLPSGSIYWHFESKEALLGAVVEKGARRWFDALPVGESLPRDPVARAVALLDAVATSLQRHPELLRLLLVIALERREVDAPSLAVIQRVRGVVLDRIRRLLRVVLDGVSAPVAERMAAECALLVPCLADGAFAARHIDPDTILCDIRRQVMGAIAVSADDGRRIVRLGMRLGVRSKAGGVRLAVDALERRLQRKELGDALRAYVRKHGQFDRRENAALSAGGIARDDQ